MIGLLLTAFIVLCIVGVILWGVNQIPGIPQVVKVVVYVIVAVVLLLWLLTFVQGGHPGLRYP
jgi:Flp pilus assembly protein TadB